MTDPAIKAALREACQTNRFFGADPEVDRSLTIGFADAIEAFLRALKDGLPLPAGTVLRDDGTPLMTQILTAVADGVARAAKEDTT
jgi:hypothetical protein